MAAPKRSLPPALAANLWRPGQSGNPSGHSGEYGVAIKLAKQAAPYAISRLIELMDSQDERVAAVACNSILDRALGKPKAVEEEKSDMEARLAAMTRQERLEYAWQLLEGMSKYLPTAAERDGGTIDSESTTEGDSVEVETDD